MTDMPEVLDADIWRRAAELNPTPTCYVLKNDRFLWANAAWCKLVGRSETELRSMTWRDLTPASELADDQLETENATDEGQLGYHVWKQYELPNKDLTDPFDLHVYRHPITGKQSGYIVFAAPRESKQYHELRESFRDLSGTVAVLSEQQAHFSALRADQMSQFSALRQAMTSDRELHEQRFTAMEKANNDTRELLTQFISRNNSVVSIGGDSNTGSYRRTETITSTNSGTVLVAMALVITVGVTAVISLIVGGYFKFDGGGKAEIKAPAVSIPYDE